MAGEYVLSIQMRAQNQAAAAMASVRQGFAQIAVAQQRVKLTTDQAKLSYDRYIQVMTNAKATQQQVQIAADQVAVALDRVKVAQGNVTTATERTRRAELQATTAMREEGTAARSTGMSLMDLASKASMVIMGLQQVAQIAVQVAQAIIEPNAAFEQMTVAMKTLLPVGNQAADMLNKLWAFAAKTPFQFPDIDVAAQKMLAFRFKAQSVIPILTAIGDSLSALGKATPAQLAGVVDIFGKIQTTGHLTAVTMMQLARRGIDAWHMLAGQMHLTVPELQAMVKKGLIPADVAISKLRAGMEATFGGGMEKQSKTFNGLMTTIKDNIQMAWRSFTGPAFDAAKQALMGVGKIVSGDQFQDFAKQLGKGIVPIFKELGNVARDLYHEIEPTVKQFAAWATKNHLLQNVLHGIVIAIRLFGQYLKFVVPIVLAIYKAVAKLALEIGSRMQPIIKQFAVFWKQHWQQIHAILVGVWNAIQGVVKVAWSVISGYIKIGLDILGGNWKQAWTDIKDMLSGIWDGIKQAVGGGLQALINMLLMAAGQIFTAMVDPWFKAYNAIAGLLHLPQAAVPTISFGAVNWFPDTISGTGSESTKKGQQQHGKSGSPSLGTGGYTGSGTGGTGGTGSGTGSHGKKQPKSQMFTAADERDIIANARKMGLHFNKILFDQMTNVQRIKYLDQLVGDNHKKLAELLKKTHKGLIDYILYYLGQHTKSKVLKPTSTSFFDPSLGIPIDSVNLKTNGSGTTHYHYTTIHITSHDAKDTARKVEKVLDKHDRLQGKRVTITSGGKI